MSLSKCIKYRGNKRQPCCIKLQSVCKVFQFGHLNAGNFGLPVSLNFQLDKSRETHGLDIKMIVFKSPLSKMGDNAF